MADGDFHVEMVAADRTVWSGDASMVVAKTVEGDIGILRGHAPVLSLLAPSPIEITSDDGVVHAAVDGGLISVAGDRVSILAEHAVLAEDISVDEERSELEAAQGLDSDDAQREVRIQRAEARIRAAEKVS